MCTYEMNIVCNNCGQTNEKVKYSHSESQTNFICRRCGVSNEVVQTFVAVVLPAEKRLTMAMEAPEKR